jgi:F-type H+/Na+-transporting ATPase subunit alpha
MSSNNYPDQVEEHVERLRQKASVVSLGVEKDTWLEEISGEAVRRSPPPAPDANVDKLIDALKQKAVEIEREVRFQAVGTVQHVGNGVATISGLLQAQIDGVVTFPTGVKGLVLNLNQDTVDVVLLGPETGIRGGDLVLSGGSRLQLPVGPRVLGRILNPLGQPLDGRGPVAAAAYEFLERDAPDIVVRSPVNESLHTGTKIIDALIPIGRGQRELILGDRQTGKTTLAVDAILSQMDTDVACFYVVIGQKKSSTLSVIERLQKMGAMAYTTVIMSSSDDPPAMRYLAPYAGTTMAEYLFYRGRDVLIIYDDLSRHADSYRELSLLLRRPPGREAYPGDIFYLHSRLLERSGKFADARGGGSLTSLPIAVTQRGNISAYIPTNLISITDGQIVLDASMFNRGIKPSIDIGRSVSRVGGAAQTKAMRELSGDLRLEISQYEEVADFARFGTELDPSTRRQIERGRRLQQVFQQPPNQPLSLGAQILVLFAASEGYLLDVEVEEVKSFERELLQYFGDNHSHLLNTMSGSGILDESLRHELKDRIDQFINRRKRGSATE